ncbi:hypothetical protein AMECASPLE_002786 [Ameca splendens]|uniref:Uncharacterized protein n=1 Tax=Ameca splendens TaxID=208324 RepID=A0ABV0ZVA3_9TELE
MNYNLSTSFPSIVSLWIIVSSWQFPCFLRLQDQELSVPCPPSNASISTKELTLSSLSSSKKQLRNQLNKLNQDNSDPKSLYPWQPDHSHSLVFSSVSVPEYFATK